MHLDAAWIGLAGVALGVVGTLVATWMTTSAQGKQAKEARREDREQKVRELAAEAYTAAAEAVQWLSPIHVEDSVDPQFADEYVPKTKHAVAHLQTARAAMMRVAALVGGELANVAGDIVVALNVLDDAWHSAQGYAKQLPKSKGQATASSKFASRQFDREYKRLKSSRKALSGFDGDELLPHEEIDQGSVLEGSLLFRLRTSLPGRIESPST